MKTAANKTNFILLVLAICFSVGLIFASVELPRLLDQFVQNNFNFLGFDQQESTLQISKTQLYFDYFHLKEIGYASLALVLILIVVGFSVGSSKATLIGAIALFLPIFGHFAFTMFFLAGLGFLRFLWIPFTDLSPIVMQLGDIALLPHNLLIKLGDFLGINLRTALPIIYISIGVGLFVWGVYTWFITRSSKHNVASTWIYKISRHPQYLGWIIWSYGLFTLPVDQMKQSWSYADSLPWLLTTLIIMAISLFEEMKMEKKYGTEYENFKSQTSFMFPMPSLIKRFLKYPVWLFFKSWDINSRKKIFVLTGTYFITLLIASFVYLAVTTPSIEPNIASNLHQKRANELINILANSTNRRQKDIAAMDLEQYGKYAEGKLIKLINNADKTTQTYAIRTIGNIGLSNACNEIVTGIENETIELNFEVVNALGNLQCRQAENYLILEMINPNSKVKSYCATALGKINAKKAIPYMINSYPENEIFNQMAYIEALGRLNASDAIPIIIEALDHSDVRLVQTAIVALSILKPTEAIPSLKAIVDKGDWETAIYAKQCIKIIASNSPDS